MGSLSSNKIPVIDFSAKDLTPESSSWCSLREEVHQALELYGCFEAVFGDSQLHRSMLQAVGELFDLPLETRQKYPTNDRNAGRSDPQIPLWCNMGITDVLSPGKLQGFTDLMWPQGNPSFCESMDSYITQGSKLEQMVKKLVFESFGVQSCYDSLADATTHWIRLNQYRVPKENETNLGLKVHTDTSFISVLSQNDVSGLEIQAKNGEWINVAPMPSNYIILAGDAFMAWSNGRLHSPPHRVVMSAEKMRYSIALFAFIKGTLIETPQQLVDEQHPQLFKPFDHLGYRSFISTEEAQKAESAIKAYCGV